MLRSIMTRARPLLAVMALLGLASLRAAQADTTVPITGIGTSIAGAFVINTHADSVTYSDPVDVVINGIAGVLLISIGILVITGELFRLNVEVQKFLDNWNLNFFQNL